MRIKDATIDEAIENIDLIRRRIPEKESLSPFDLVERLKGKVHGIKIAIGESIDGLMIWYDDEGDLYLWIGAVEKPGIGIGSKIMRTIDSETYYNRWYVKIKHGNKLAKNCLDKFGFKKYKID